jgi:glucosamine-6-phosphate deaminase
MEAQIGEFQIDRLRVEVFRDRAALGLAAAAAAAERIRAMQKEGRPLNLLLASGLSQVETLAALRKEPGIRWERACAFHLDEYIGLPADAPQAFGQFLRDRFFDGLPLGQVFYLHGNAPDLRAECERYARLLREHPPDLALMGIGENGHLAFNDPGVADFEDPLPVKVVEELDPTCRQQQVNDGQFRSLAEVPRRAITLTIPSLFAARTALVMVPGPTKRDIVRRALRGPIEESCPATILRRHPDASLFLDRESAALL